MGTRMTPAKRALDLTVALLLGAVLIWPLLLLIIILLVTEGRPIFYVSDRMTTPDRSFRLIKLRTMRAATDPGGVTGGDKTNRMSRLHRLMRRTRADEVPQLWNVLRGDISLVGPRPPLPVYVRDYPDLYARVLRSRPGITGLATLHFADHEELLLSRCRTAAETDAVYRRRCIPRKARLDLIYQRRRSLFLDLALIARTAARPFARLRTGRG
jgi:lipopolysaccharide/colanic/teichoic acid biosynthesis glycosyltransferase